VHWSESTHGAAALLGPASAPLGYQLGTKTRSDVRRCVCGPAGALDVDADADAVHLSSRAAAGGARGLVDLTRLVYTVVS
jgi:hypothetical protein